MVYVCILCVLLYVLLYLLRLFHIYDLYTIIYAYMQYYYSGYICSPLLLLKYILLFIYNDITIITILIDVFYAFRITYYTVSITEISCNIRQ